MAEGLRAGERKAAFVGRVVGVQGFSTLPDDELILLDSDGERTEGSASLIASLGAARLKEAAQSLPTADRPERVHITIGERDAVRAGLACGGRAEVLLQPVATIPARFWDLLAGRAPVALLTSLEDRGPGPSALVVDADGQTWGWEAPDAGLVSEAVEALQSGRSSRRQIEHEDGAVLLETWVPEPRLVVVGGRGELLDALVAQSGLLGWEVRESDDAGEVDKLLDWAGATAALIVLSHDPGTDVPSLATGLARRAPYVGAMGSRNTQSRRITRLSEAGVAASDIDRIHRPIGLDLGGRRAPEVALAIVAEVLACHCGRDARPLQQRSGPIHGDH